MDKSIPGRKQRLITTLANKDDNKLPSIPHIQADENLEAELVRFEHVMVNYKVSKDKWPSKLYPILTGKALDIYLRMPPTDTAAIKDALLLNAGITPENKLQELLHLPVRQLWMHMVELKEFFSGTAKV